MGKRYGMKEKLKQAFKEKVKSEGFKRKTSQAIYKEIMELEKSLLRRTSKKPNKNHYLLHHENYLSESDSEEREVGILDKMTDDEQAAHLLKLWHTVFNKLRGVVIFKQTFNLVQMKFSLFGR